jgi:serine/threonine protein kinase
LDFGLAKNLRSFAELELTAADSVVGTPLYLAPEGVERPDAVDARSDLYAVGAIGYFLLTGKPLFEQRNLREVLMLQMNTLPVKPSERLGRSIDPDLEEVIMRCLGKDPATRPQNALLLDEALAQCSSASEWTRKEAEAWWSRNVAHVSEESPAPADGETQAFAKVIISR